MVIAMRFFCAGQAEISLKAEGNNPQPGLNRCWGIRREGFSSVNCQWLQPFKSHSSLLCLSQARTGDRLMILFICCHSNVFFKKGNKRGKKKNLLKDFVDIFPKFMFYYYSVVFFLMTDFILFFFKKNSFDLENNPGQTKQIVTPFALREPDFWGKLIFSPQPETHVFLPFALSSVPMPSLGVLTSQSGFKTPIRTSPPSLNLWLTQSICPQIIYFIDYVSTIALLRACQLIFTYYIVSSLRVEIKSRVHLCFLKQIIKCKYLQIPFFKELFHESSGSPSVVLGPAVSTSSVNLLEIHIVWSYPWPPESAA